MLHGFGALAPAYARPIATRPHELEQGPAYGAANSGEIAKAAAPLARADDWPIFRGDAWRTGSNPTAVPAELKTVWSAAIAAPLVPDAVKGEWDEYPFAAGPLTPPVIAQGLAVVAQPHAHRVLAFDATDGKPRWSFVADGRIDSAPTIDRGLCLFGTRAGWVYCLRAADGALVWRLRVAPAELRIVHCGQLESPWPAQGSVLVSDGLAYVGVGIHPLADGGVRVLAIEPATGAIRWEKTLTDMGYDEHGWHNRLGLEQDYFDLLVRDGPDKVAMSRWLFDPASGAFDFKWHDAFYRVGEKSEAYMQRGTWSYGYAMNRPRMRRPLLVARGNSVLGANRVREVKDAKEPGGGTVGGPHLFRRDFKAGEKFDTRWDELPNDTLSRIGQYFPANRIAENVTWQSAYPGWIEAMTLAGDRLFVYAKEKLRAYDATTGALTGDVEFAGHPVWDGVAAAHGRLYVSTREGRVVCLAGR
jgi:outer membrane protein assembly factor BamB